MAAALLIQLDRNVFQIHVPSSANCASSPPPTSSWFELIRLLRPLYYVPPTARRICILWCAARNALSRVRTHMDTHNLQIVTSESESSCRVFLQRNSNTTICLLRIDKLMEKCRCKFSSNKHKCIIADAPNRGAVEPDGRLEPNWNGTNLVLHRLLAGRGVILGTGC